jgi:GNAT superfamily N-acetyltransferase
MITIKKLTAEDMKEAIQLKVNCWTEELAGKAENTLNYSKELEFWVDWMSSAEENQDVRFLVGAFEDNKMLGVAFASFAETEDISEKGIELNGLWVYSEQRGRGISLKLIAYILDFYKNMGKDKIVIYNHHFCPSNNFYRKFGADVIRQDEQMGGKLIVDVFLADIDVFKNNIEKLLLKYS